MLLAITDTWNGFELEKLLPDFDTLLSYRDETIAEFELKYGSDNVMTIIFDETGNYGWEIWFADGDGDIRFTHTTVEPAWEWLV